ncbi:hypothetical protein BYT27DRAFT_7186421 [Phlegmacium glaucopus]|nr:hypothetical protein BYT27DRAFT_7186421 [Phlegmacium glaucopus]
MLPRSSLGFYLSPPNPQGSLYCPCSRILSLPVRWLFGSLNSLLFFVTDLNTFEKRYFIVASTRYGESPIVSPNSSTICLVSFRPLADASSGAGYVICILQRTNNTMQFVSIPPIMNQTIVPKKPFGKQSK